MVWAPPKLSLHVEPLEIVTPATPTTPPPKKTRIDGAHELASEGAFWALHDEVSTLGKGSYGTVKLIRVRSTGSLVAVKEVTKGTSLHRGTDIDETKEAQVLNMLRRGAKAATAPARIGGRRAAGRQARPTISALKAAMEGSGTQPGASPSSVLASLEQTLGSPRTPSTPARASSVGPAAAVALSGMARRKPRGEHGLSVWQLQAALAEVPQQAPAAAAAEEKEVAALPPTAEATAWADSDADAEATADTVRLLDVYDTPSTLFLVMRAEMGGDLASRLASLPSGVCPEAEARTHAAALLRGLESTHAKGIVHRDIKPANVLLSEEGVGRLGDYGLAANLPEEGLLTAVCGTHNNMCPEMVRCGHGDSEGYGTAADMWQMGLLLFEMLCGTHPFVRETEVATLTAILDGTFSFPEGAPVSEQARDLLRRLLVTDPAGRLSATQCLHHPWVRQRRASHE